MSLLIGIVVLLLIIVALQGYALHNFRSAFRDSERVLRVIVQADPVARGCICNTILKSGKYDA